MDTLCIQETIYANILLASTTHCTLYSTQSSNSGDVYTHGWWAKYILCSVTSSTQWLVMAARLKIGRPLCCHFRAKFASVNFNLLRSDSCKSGFVARIWDMFSRQADVGKQFCEGQSCWFWHHGFIPSPFCAWASQTNCEQLKSLVTISANNCWLVLILSSSEKSILQQGGWARCGPSPPKKHCVGGLRGFAYWMAPRHQYWLQFFFRKGYVCADVGRWGKTAVGGVKEASTYLGCTHVAHRHPVAVCCTLLACYRWQLWETCPLPCF